MPHLRSVVPGKQFGKPIREGVATGFDSVGVGVSLGVPCDSGRPPRGTPIGTPDARQACLPRFQDCSQCEANASRMMRLEERHMGYPPSAMTAEQKILAALARIESKVDDIERRVKAVQQDVNRVKRIVRG